jgi:hypothetical protein
MAFHHVKKQCSLHRKKPQQGAIFEAESSPYQTTEAESASIMYSKPPDL